MCRAIGSEKVGASLRRAKPDPFVSFLITDRRLKSGYPPIAQRAHALARRRTFLVAVRTFARRLRIDLPHADASKAGPSPNSPRVNSAVFRRRNAASRLSTSVVNFGPRAISKRSLPIFRTTNCGVCKPGSLIRTTASTPSNLRVAPWRARFFAMTCPNKGDLRLAFTCMPFPSTFTSPVAETSPMIFAQADSVMRCGLRHITPSAGSAQCTNIVANPLFSKSSASAGDSVLVLPSCYEASHFP
jgi:hypothetical protein